MNKKKKKEEKRKRKEEEERKRTGQIKKLCPAVSVYIFFPQVNVPFPLII